MLFNSLHFAIFFPTVTAAYFLCPRNVRWILLLVASYAFYMAWRWEYGVLLATMSLVDWFVALRIEAAPTDRGKRLWLLITILGNFGMLSVFKYWNMFNGAAIEGAAMAGFHWPIPALAIFLPVGISFHTFQTVGYAVDVYRGKLPAEPNPLRFALFVSFFPQLVAGPIERATRLLPQLQRPTDFDYDRMVSGLRQAGWGMFKKVVVADRLAVLVNQVYGDPEEFQGFGLALAALFFVGQVYCDFSGYSDIAIGTARVLGFDLMKNFDHPYGARSMTELWSRWHISLSTWFRDYLYFPLGGNRVSFARWSFNVTLVFFVSGIWHGAEWRFALWGLMHGGLLVADRVTLPLRDRVAAALRLEELGLRGPIATSLMLVLWGLTLVPFRAESTADVAYVYTHLASGWSRIGDVEALAWFLDRVHMDVGMFALCLLLMPLVYVVDAARRRGSWVAWMEARPTSARWAVDYLVFFGILFLGHWADLPFVYFQF